MNLSLGALYAWFVAHVIFVLPKIYYSISIGLGISISCLLSFILYLLDRDYSFIRSARSLYLYGMVSVLVIILYIYSCRQADALIASSEKSIEITMLNDKNKSILSYLVLLSIFVLLVNIIKGLGFFQPSADVISHQINVEVIRLFYIVALLVAASLNDKSRRLGLLLAFISLSFTFAIPIMRDSVHGIIFSWILSYIFIGFIYIYSAVAFLDVAVDTDMAFLAPLGVLLGRIGQPIGEFIRICLSNNNGVLLFVTAIFVTITIIVFALLFSMLYSVESDVDSRQVFMEKYGLSLREMDILDEILLGKSNSKIAISLSITDSTVKFHAKNLLKKTGCANRKELIVMYRRVVPQ